MNVDPKVNPSLGYLEALSQKNKVTACTLAALAAIAVGVAAASLFGLSVLPPAAAYSIVGVGLASYVVMAIAIKIHHDRRVAAAVVAHHQEIKQRWQGIGARAVTQARAAVVALRNEKATKIQTAVRGFLARKAYVAQRDAARAVVAQRDAARAVVALRNEKATKIQSAVRGFLARRDYVAQRDAARAAVVALRNEKATKIKSAFKGFLARRAYVAQRDAAIVLQKHFRGIQGRLVAKRHYVAQSGAALVLQKHFRGIQGRLVARHQQEAMHAHFRGQVYRLMAVVLSGLEAPASEATASMMNRTRLQIKAFEWVSLPLKNMIFSLARDAGMTPEQGAELFLQVHAQLSLRRDYPDGTCEVRNHYLALIALLLIRTDPALVTEVRRVLNWTDESSKHWQQNARELLTHQLITQFTQAITNVVAQARGESVIKGISPKSINQFCIALKGIVKGDDYGSFLHIFRDKFSAQEYRAHELRLIAHGLSYTHLAVGQKDPDVGEVIFRYLEGGVNYFVSVFKQEDGSYKLHFCSAGTHEMGGVARDVNPVSATPSWKSHVTRDTLFAIIQALYTKLRTDFGQVNSREPTHKELEAIPLVIECHGHSLAGHDAQLFALALMNEKVKPVGGLLNRQTIRSILINTQNALRINVAEATEYARLAVPVLEAGVDLFNHVGFIPYDVVQQAGSRLAGSGCESLEEAYAERRDGKGCFKLTIAEHRCASLEQWGSILTAAPHTAATATTKPVFIDDKRARHRVLAGGGFGFNGGFLERPVDLLTAVVKAPLWGVARAAACFTAASSGGASALTDGPDLFPGSGDSFVDIVTGGHARVDLAQEELVEELAAADPDAADPDPDAA